MSYDLMVFDPAAAPAGRDAFMEWYDRQTEWEEDHDYQDPTVSAPILQAWMAEMVLQLPSWDQIDDEDQYDGPNASEYNTGKSIIYIAFSWSNAELAHELTFQLAKKHRLGFFDIGAPGADVWMPTPDGGYAVAHREGD